MSGNDLYETENGKINYADGRPKLEDSCRDQYDIKSVYFKMGGYGFVLLMSFVFFLRDLNHFS